MPPYKRHKVNPVVAKEFCMEKITYMLKLLTIFVLISVLMDSMALAAGDGTSSGGGGAPECADYVSHVRKVGEALFNIGQDKVNEINNTINVEELFKSSRKFNRCIPVKKFPKEVLKRLNLEKNYGQTAITIRESDEEIITYLIWKRWTKMNALSKIDLSSHELAVGMVLETEGNYQTVSLDISEMVQSTRFFAGTKCGSINFLNGIMTCIEPRYIYSDYSMIANGSDITGICKYLGYSSPVSVTVSPSTTTVLGTKLNSAGLPMEFGTYRYEHYTYSISCIP
jgi:hypothetical protein